MSTRREATGPFTFSDGTRLNQGDWAVTPLLAINKLPEYYPQPGQFNGFRFVSKEVLDSINCSHDSKNTAVLQSEAQQAKPSKLTDIDPTWLMFGIGKQSCPGRFYASAVMKVIISQIVANYDCKLVDPRATEEVMWVMRSAQVPKHGVKVVLTAMEE